MSIKKIIASLSALLAGCGGIDGQQYTELSPELKLESYFNGPIKAWGFIQDRSGNVITRFDVVMEGSWDGNKGRLDEVFTYYDNGKVQNRTWEITKIDEFTYEGKAGDILGTAKGSAHGNAINWVYEMDVPVDDTTYRLKFDDWMWAMNDGVVINRSYMKKFGITVAELTVFMQKVPDGSISLKPSKDSSL
ncbi:DUF3833 domain-containing protein [Thorsellia kenyensis]|uniref:DUF3833 domain-containing protein n=1 Tax=Thorsellia kenyensis TaxID=1549888 RepID=A0ABV6CAQ6_9GAMM